MQKHEIYVTLFSKYVDFKMSEIEIEKRKIDTTYSFSLSIFRFSF